MDTGSAINWIDKDYLSQLAWTGSTIKFDGLNIQPLAGAAVPVEYVKLTLAFEMIPYGAHWRQPKSVIFTAPFVVIPGASVEMGIGRGTCMDLNISVMSVQGITTIAVYDRNEITSGPDFEIKMAPFKATRSAQNLSSSLVCNSGRGEIKFTGSRSAVVSLLQEVIADHEEPEVRQWALNQLEAIMGYKVFPGVAGRDEKNLLAPFGEFCGGNRHTGGCTVIAKDLRTQAGIIQVASHQGILAGSDTRLVYDLGDPNDEVFRASVEQASVELLGTTDARIDTSIVRKRIMQMAASSHITPINSVRPYKSEFSSQFITTDRQLARMIYEGQVEAARKRTTLCREIYSAPCYQRLFSEIMEGGGVRAVMFGGYPLDPRFEAVDIPFCEHDPNSYIILWVRNEWNESGLPHVATRFCRELLDRAAELLGTTFESIVGILSGVLTPLPYTLPGREYTFLRTEINEFPSPSRALWNLDTAIKVKYKEARMLAWAETGNLNEILDVINKHHVDSALAFGGWHTLGQWMRPVDWVLSPKEMQQYEEVVKFFKQEDTSDLREDIQMAECTFPSSFSITVRMPSRVLARVAACLVISKEQLLGVLAGNLRLEVKQNRDLSYRVETRSLGVISPKATGSVQVEFSKVQRRLPDV